MRRLATVIHVYQPKTIQFILTETTLIVTHKERLVKKSTYHVHVPYKKSFTNLQTLLLNIILLTGTVTRF